MVSIIEILCFIKIGNRYDEMYNESKMCVVI